MLGGVAVRVELSGWLANEPIDPLRQPGRRRGTSTTSAGAPRQACWDSTAAPVAQQVPLVLGELGQDDGGSDFVDSLMDWMDARSGSYLAWEWDVWGQPLDLISSYDGTPTPYGQTFKTRFAQ